MSYEKEVKSPCRGEFIGRIVEHLDFGSKSKGIVLELTGKNAEIFSSAHPGQFVQLTCRDLNEPRSSAPLLRRPFSIAGIASRRNEDQICVSLEIIYQVVGPGTLWLRQQKTGSGINLLGPLGNSFTLPGDSKKRVILLGGGVGLPPMFFLTERLADAGHKEIRAFAGIQTEDHFKPGIITQKFQTGNSRCEISTDDGSYGFHGNAVNALENLLGKELPWQKALIFACGPKGMLKAVADLADRFNMRCQVCMEAYMACGIGVCQSCAVAVHDRESKKPQTEENKRYKLVCADGPVFDSREIIWDD